MNVFYYLTLSFIVIHILSGIDSFELNSIVIDRERYIRERHIRFDYKQWETCAETFFRTLKQKVSLDCWSIISEFISGNKNIALIENKKNRQGRFKPFEHISYPNFFPLPIIKGDIIKYSLWNFCPDLLINQIGMSASS